MKKLFLVLLELAVCVVFVAQAASPGKAETAKVFERFKSLVGDWEGESSKGWTDRISFTLLAGGSAVEQRSFDAHPGETMVTIVHPDGDRLLLTHYCAAKNQPRLRLAHVADDGQRATFEFMDATNLASRDQGHMDKVVFTFPDDDHFSEQWTWYAKGTGRWQEVIHHRRIQAAPRRE